MGSFEADTRIEDDGEGLRANLSPDWEIWGLNGGYVATVALRAAARRAAIQRPVSFYCHFLRVAKPGLAELAVTPLQQGRQAESIRVSMSQGGKLVLEALVRTASVVPGLVHDDVVAPDVPRPEVLPSFHDLLREEHPRFPFWSNFDVRVLLPERFEIPRGPMPPRWLEWYRFIPDATFDDPFVEAGRSLVLIDTLSWPATWLRHPDPAYLAPSLDVGVFFHRSARESPWLLAQQESPVGSEGLVGGTGRVFDEAGRLVASGGAQLLCLPAARVT